ncbi:hypothetical protein [Kutzneria kofuensis]|uniref:Uncharacterized protein n=1 Tax=Kutzneria kofuensis TaxID=103725 RepID=A0A7W9NEJ7_9PSEU|nr:hypothetical protein [Kutzneria kofuensis]MBB5890407.1 hypothetical protein [Kutzneria kofuensis]
MAFRGTLEPDRHGDDPAVDGGVGQGLRDELVLDAGIGLGGTCDKGRLGGDLRSDGRLRFTRVRCTATGAVISLAPRVVRTTTACTCRKPAGGSGESLDRASTRSPRGITGPVGSQPANFSGEGSNGSGIIFATITSGPKSVCSSSCQPKTRAVTKSRTPPDSSTNVPGAKSSSSWGNRTTSPSYEELRHCRSTTLNSRSSRVGAPSTALSINCLWDTVCSQMRTVRSVRNRTFPGARSSWSNECS